MKNLTSNAMIATLALASASLVAPSADAAAFGGLAVLASAARVVNTTNQVTTWSNLLSLSPRVTLCSGAVEFPAFAYAGGSSVQAIGSCYTIKATVLAVNQTRFEVFYNGAPGSGIALIEFGGPNSQVGFDRTNPNPGTGGSFNGRDFQYLAGVGAWNVFAYYHTPVQIAGLAIQNDLYAKLFVKFDQCFDINDRLLFDVDTDRLF